MRTGLGIEIGRTAVAEILAAAGIEPSPEREKQRTWKQFITAHFLLDAEGSQHGALRMPLPP